MHKPYKNFLSFLSNQHLELFRCMLRSFRGTHRPIKYQKQFNFQQRWEKNAKINEQSNFNFLTNSNKLGYIFNFWFMLQNICIVWYLSIFRLYSIQSDQLFFVFAILLSLFYSAYKTKVIQNLIHKNLYELGFHKNFHWGLLLFYYIYSLYFACTTMFTVSYGDIIPTNKPQIVTIMCIQAIGMILLYFIINEVGVALGNMRQRRANLEKDIFNSDQIASHYDLNVQLAKKMRDYVINNHIAQDQLAASQQNQFLMKLNQELRNQVKQSNQLKIIKTSIFLISHWSKKIQVEIARKLNKCIYAPNQNIHLKTEVNKLYIMVRGKIEVYTERRLGTKLYCRKLLKTIQKLPQQQIFNNVYGYTSFFSGKPNRLKAEAKDSSVCYTLNYDDIRDAINEDHNDFQYFHQLRQKFQLSKNPQIWETPNIVNSRQNYYPINFYVIKKFNKFYKNQNRKNWNRRQIRKKLICENSYQSFNQFYELSDSQKSQLIKDKFQQENSYKNQILFNYNQKNDPIKNDISSQNKLFQSLNKKPIMIANRSYRRKHLQKEQKLQDKCKIFMDLNKFLTSNFQIQKIIFDTFQKVIPRQCCKNYQKILKLFAQRRQIELKVSKDISKNYQERFHQNFTRMIIKFLLKIHYKQSCKSNLKIIQGKRYQISQIMRFIYLELQEIQLFLVIIYQLYEINILFEIFETFGFILVKFILCHWQNYYQYKAITKMGICYSEEQQWEAYNKTIRERRRNKKKNRQGSIIHEQKSIYQSSFASKVQNSFRQDLHSSIQNLVSEIGSIAIGSIVEMKQQELKYLYESLQKINPNGQTHPDSEPITLCNLKTKNFLHTHKISFPDLPKLHQVSCCPYNSNHIIQYDIWKFVKVSGDSEIDTTNQSQSHEDHQQDIGKNSYYIYHPFTQRFLNVKKGYVICSEQKMQWQVIPFGRRRNSGFIKIVSEQGQLCMSDQKGLLSNHRKLNVCKEQHISHLWQISFGQII